MKEPGSKSVEAKRPRCPFAGWRGEVMRAIDTGGV